MNSLHEPTRKEKDMKEKTEIETYLLPCDFIGLRMAKSTFANFEFEPELLEIEK